MRVIKISGHQLDDDEFVEQFATAVAQIAKCERVIVVNGGGKSIKALQEALGLQEDKIDGLRVTDAASLTITEMVMSAQINKLVVRALIAAGLDAVGVSGEDGRLLVAQKKVSPKGELGFVGEIVGVRTDLLLALLTLGLTLVISPVSCDTAGQHYNVNADEAATAIALALTAEQLDFVSNVPGVLRNLSDPKPISILTPGEVEQLTAAGVISGGMVPKVASALEALEQGVQQVRIVDLAGLAEGGTVFKADGVA